MRLGRRWLWITMMALGLVLGVAFAGHVTAQDPLLWARNVAGDSRPIQISADDAVTWVEQGRRILLLKGKVWVEQGDANLRAQQAVIWLPDEAEQKKTGIYHVELFGDGGVSLELGAQNYESPQALIELNTRGAVNVKTFKNKIAMRPAQDDPLYGRAVTAMNGQPKPAQPSAQAINPIKQVAKREGLPPSPDLVAPFDPKLSTAPAENLQQVQYVSSQQTPGGRALPTAQSPQVYQPPVVVPPPTPPGASGSFTQPQPPPVVVTPAPVITPPPGEEAVEKPRPIVGIRSRSSEGIQLKSFPMDNGETAFVLSPGVLIRIAKPATPSSPPTEVEIGADRVVLWTKGKITDFLDGRAGGDDQRGRRMEFYLSGNVEIFGATKGKTGDEPKIVRCNEAYYDAGRDVAIMLDADLELKQPGLPDPIHITVPVMHQLSSTLVEAPQSQLHASKLAVGPGVYLTTGQASLEEKRIEKKSIFGAQFYNRNTGEVEFENQTIFRGSNVVLWLESIPIFWLPYVQGDARDPLGPLESVSIGYSKTFGFELRTTWDMYDLIGVDPVPNSRWQLNIDGLTARGPALGTNFFARGDQLAGISGKYDIGVKAYGIFDTGEDRLGGDRGTFVKYGDPLITLPITHPEWRGRFLAGLNWQELPCGLTVQSQLSVISDKNFLDQYYNAEWLNGLNQETFIYGKQQIDNWAVTGLFEPRIRNWITEGEWLPKVEGFLIGQDVFQYFTYTTRASAGYGHLLTTHQPPPPFEPTDVGLGTGRFDWWNEVALPLQLGAFKVVPYGVVDLTYYTDTIPGDATGRFYGGGGVRGSIPFSRLYADSQSELFNVNGIFHKMVFSGNYYWAHSDRSHLLFPQLDRLNDDETDQAMRDIYPQQFLVNPTNATMLNSGFFDPQLYALRKLVLNKVDTLDSIETVQLDFRQRWQTKRGFPGQQHIIDWMTLDLSAAFFPQANRDNFGELVNFLEYDWSWNIGDRFTLFSAGWFDPHEGAARVWSFGTQMNRPDRSSLYLGYRQIDPLESKQIIAAITVPFSAKYSMSASSSYDFGVNNQINSLSFTRTGTDLTVTLGFTYNTIINNFGLIFEVSPNLLPAQRRVPGVGHYLTQSLKQGT